MKFNDSQKKWAMTGVLLAALGFNISPPKSMKSFTLLDMASSEEVKVDKITNEKGVYKVVYRASGKDKTIAEVSQVYTEAGAAISCDDCTSQYEINRPATAKIDELNLILAKHLSKKNQVEAIEEEAVASQEERAKPSRKEVAKREKAEPSKDKKDKFSKLNKALQSLAEQCSDKEAGKDENMTCYSEGLTSLFSDLESDEINDTTVLSFINRRVMPIQADLVLENRQKYYAYATGKGEKPESTAEVLSKFEDFMTAIPEGHDKLQQDLVNSTAAIKAADLRFINSLKAKAQNATGAEKTDLLNESIWRTQANPALDSELTSMSQRIAEVTSGMQQANKFSAGLQQALNQAFMSVGSSTGTTATTVVDANGNTWVRADMAGRGFSQAGPTTNLGNAVVPQGIPNGANFPQPIVPTVPSGLGTSTLQPVPQTYGQPQTQYQQQQFMQPQMYAQPQMQQQYGTTNQPGVINMGTVNGSNQTGVINMGTVNNRVGTRY